MIGFIAVIAALAWYFRCREISMTRTCGPGRLRFAMLESETTFGYVLKRLVTVHLAVILLSGVLWYFGIRQVVETLRSLWRRKPVSYRAGPAYFLVRSQLSGHLCRMAISGTLSFASASAAVDSRRPGVRTLCRRTTTLFSATLAIDPNRHHRGDRAANDKFSPRGLCSANADAQFSPDCSADRQGDEPERSYLCLGKFAATLQFFRPADGYSFRELLTLGWRLRQPAS